MQDDIKGTWEEVIQRNEKELNDLELRVVRSHYRELHHWKGVDNFTLGQGTAASTYRWYLFTPEGNFFGDSMEEVLRQAEPHYPDILSWVNEFNVF